MLGTLWRWGPVLLYALFISVLSSQSNLKVPAEISDKVAHAMEFGILAALLWRASNGRFLPERPSARPAAVALGLCAAYSALDEFHQSFVPGRESSLWDAAADTGGAVGVVLLLWGLSILWSRRSRSVAAGAADSAAAVVPTPTLTLLSKKECPLCDEAEKVILQVREELPFEFEKIDISGDADLRGRYRFDVPVLLMEGQEIFRHRVDARGLRSRLLRAREAGHAAEERP